jgi:hypothetical protein
MQTKLLAIDLPPRTECYRSKGHNDYANDTAKQHDFERIKGKANFPPRDCHHRKGCN